MMDRRGSLWSPRLLVPVVVLLQVGLFWLALRVAHPRTEQDLPDAPDRGGRPAVEAVTGDGSETVSAQPESAERPPRWLPPLSDSARTVLTSFQSLPEAAGLSVATRSPELISPTPSDAQKEKPEAGPAVTKAQSPSEGSGGLMPPEEALGAAAAWPTAPAPAAAPAEQAPLAVAAPDGQPAEKSAQPQLMAKKPAAAAPEETAAAAPKGPSPATPAKSAQQGVASSQPGIIDPQSPSPIGPSTQDDEFGQAKPFNPPGEATGPRSLQLERIARQADMHSRRAFDLAGRKAYFSARSEFIMALRLVSEGLDTEARTNAHSKALALGLRALKEAEDFLPRGSRLEADLDLPGIIASHQTPVLKGFPLDGLTPMAAFQRYHTFAQEQLATSVGREVAGSMALQGLGKLYAALADNVASGVKAPQSKAVAYYQAAILVFPENYMASNDLGVLLARAGYYDDAKIALVHSLSIHPEATGWRNLAVVYRQLGQMNLALQAAERWQTARRAELSRTAGRSEDVPAVRWLSPDMFAQTYLSMPDEPRTETAQPAQAAKTESEPERPVARQAATRRWPAGESNFPY